MTPGVDNRGASIFGAETHVAFTAPLPMWSCVARHCSVTSNLFGAVDDRSGILLRSSPSMDDALESAADVMSPL